MISLLAATLVGATAIASVLAVAPYVRSPKRWRLPSAAHTGWVLEVPAPVLPAGPEPARPAPEQPVTRSALHAQLLAELERPTAQPPGCRSHRRRGRCRADRLC